MSTDKAALLESLESRVLLSIGQMILEGPQHVTNGHDLYIYLNTNWSGSGSSSIDLSCTQHSAGTTVKFGVPFSDQMWQDSSPNAIYNLSAASGGAVNVIKIAVAPGTVQDGLTLTINAHPHDNSGDKTATFTFHSMATPADPTLTRTFDAPHNISSTDIAAWENNMKVQGQKYGDPDALVANGTWEGSTWYYDGARVFAQVAEYSGQEKWLASSEACEQVWRDYVLANGGGVPGWRLFTKGLLMDYLREPVDSQERADDYAAIVGLWTNSLGGSGNLGIANPDGSRETAYAIDAGLAAAQVMGANWTSANQSRLQRYVDSAIGHMTTWFVDQQFYPLCTPAIQPWMVGLTAEALIGWYDYMKTQGVTDTRVPDLLKRGADWVYANAWLRTATPNADPHASDPNYVGTMYQQMRFQRDANGYALMTPANMDYGWYPDGMGTLYDTGHTLMNLTAMPYAWVYSQYGENQGSSYRVEGDDLFNKAVSGNKNDQWGKGKDYSQNYRYSFDYVQYRLNNAWPDSTSPTVTSLTNSDLGSGAVSLTWTTSEPTETMVEWGTTSSYGQSLSNSYFMTAHDQEIRGLQPGGTYHYRICSTDANGNVTYSADATFTAPGEAGLDNGPGGRLYFTGVANDGSFVKLETAVMDEEWNLAGSIIDHGSFNNSGITTSSNSWMSYRMAGITPRLVTANASGYNSIAMGMFWANGTYSGYDRPTASQGSQYPVPGIIRITPTDTSATTTVLGTGRAYAYGDVYTEGGSSFLPDPTGSFTGSGQAYNSFVGTSYRDGYGAMFSKVWERGGSSSNITDAADISNITAGRGRSYGSDFDRGMRLVDNVLWQAYQTNSGYSNSIRRIDSNLNVADFLVSERLFNMYGSATFYGFDAGKSTIGGQDRETVWVMGLNSSNAMGLIRAVDLDGDGTADEGEAGEVTVIYDSSSTTVAGDDVTGNWSDLRVVTNGSSKFLAILAPADDRMIVLQLDPDGTFAGGNQNVKVVNLPSGTLHGSNYLMTRMLLDTNYKINKYGVIASGTTFTISRAESGTAQRVNFTLSGSGIETTDFTTDAPSHYVDFGVNDTQKTIAITSLTSQNRNITLTIAGGDYYLGDDSATILLNNNQTAPAATGMIVEAEDMTLFGFDRRWTASGGGSVEVRNPAASGTATIRLAPSAAGVATYVFEGASSKYDLKSWLFDVNTGTSKLKIRVNGNELDSWLTDRRLGSSSADSLSRTSHTTSGIWLNSGDVIELAGTAGTNELLDVDALEFIPVNATSSLPTISLMVNDHFAGEPRIYNGPGNAVFKLIRSGNTSGSTTVNFTFGGSAQRGTDYTTPEIGAANSVVFAAGETSKVITITPSDDNSAEGGETVSLTLESSSNYQLACRTAGVSLSDALPVLAVSASSSTVNEGSGCDFTITRTSNFTPDQPLTVYYYFAGTANQGSDFTEDGAGSVTFAVGETSKTIHVTASNDGLVEDDASFHESFSLILRSMPYYRFDTGSAAVSVIDAQQGTPSAIRIYVTASNPVAAERRPGYSTSNGSFTIYRVGNTSGSLTVPFTFSGTAGSGDFTTDAGSAYFAPGETAVIVTIGAVDDAVLESAESVTLNITTNPSLYGIGNGSASINIFDNDMSFSVAASGSPAENGPATGTFTITRTGDTGSSAVINVGFSGTGRFGNDYSVSPASPNIVFAPGETSKTITVTPVDDSVGEEIETVSLGITSSGSYAVGTASATLEIADNDSNINWTDDFGGTSLASRWTTYSPDYTISNGCLNAVVSDSWNGSGAQNLFLADAPEGDFIATMKISHFEPTTTYAQAAIGLYSADRTYYAKLGYLYDSSDISGSHRGLEIGIGADGNEDDSLSTYAERNFGTGAFYLRVMRIGEVITYSSSTDGSSFVILNSASWNQSGSLTKIGMWFGADMSDTSTIAQVDSFSVAQLSGYKDDFSGSSLDSRWTSYDPDYTIANGYLNAVVSDSWNGSGASNLLLAEAPSGDFVATMKINNFEPTSTYAQAALGLYSADRTSYAKIGYLFDSYDISGSHRGLEIGIGGNGTEDDSLSTYDELNFGSSPFYLRITRNGNVISYLTSTDNVHYSELNHAAYSGQSLTTIGMWFGADMSNSSTVAQVDWFQLLWC